MQAEDIIEQQLNPEGQVQKPLFQTNPDLRLGFIVFNTGKHPINKDIQLALKYLSRFYSREYVTDIVGRKYIQNKKSPYNSDQIQEIKKDLISYFSLESVFDYHVHLVSRTYQRYFTLENADFKIMKNSPIKNLRQQNLWSVNFIQLKCMDLSNCDLTNIQGLTFCNLPKLEKLQLGNNHISSIQALTKCDFKSLKQITFHSNPLSNIKKMMRLQCPNLEKISIQNEKQNRFFERLTGFNRPRQQSSWYMEIIDFMIKLECIQSVKQLPVKFLHRLKPKWHQEILKKINPELNIYTKYQKLRMRFQQIMNQQQNENQFEFFHQQMDQQDNIDPAQERRDIREEMREFRNQRRAQNILRRAQQRQQRRSQNNQE